MVVLKAVAVAVIGLTLGGAAFRAEAGPELLTNGNFDQTTLTYAGIQYSGQFTGTQVTGWTNAATTGYTGYGYNFLVRSGDADTAGFYSNGGNHDYLWGPGGGILSTNYSNNGLTAASPQGGNYILADGDSTLRGAISQTVGNLTIGQSYLLTFYWAAAQFAGNTGTTTEAWQVRFGDSLQNTPTVTTASKGFTPWRQQAMYFTATAVTQTLSFLAIGTPNGAPPSALLDGVSLTAAPEPSTIAVLLAGLAGFTAVTWKRRRSGVAGS